MRAYYNDTDPYVVEWLKNLIKAGLIMEGDVDDRSIKEVSATDVARYGRVHFFAGIGGWDLALQYAGWPEDRPVWTGSCPCQPFSGAGRRKGTADERHLWPEFRRLINECKPPVVFGEQTASKDGRIWLSGVRTDLEAMGYAVGGADLCAAGIAAPHIRQRLYWMADSTGKRHEDFMERPDEGAEEDRVGEATISRGSGTDSRMGDTIIPGLEGHPGNVSDRSESGRLYKDKDRPASTAGRDSWSDYILIPCADGKQRRIKPGLEPLASGVPGRVGQIRAYGNAIVPQLAAEFIRAYLEIFP